MIQAEWLRRICADKETSTLTVRQMAILIYLRSVDGDKVLRSVSSRRLAAQLRLEPSGTYRALVGLLDRGLIVKHSHQYNLKKFSYTLTPKGLTATAGIAGELKPTA